MKRIFTAILSLALVSASFIGCNEETPEAVERHLNPLTNEALVEGVEVSTEVFLYGATKTYTLKYKLNEEAVVSCPEGWTAEYDAEANILTVAAPAAAGEGATKGTVAIEGTHYSLECQANVTFSVTVRGEDAVAFGDEAFRNYLAEEFGGSDGVLSAEEAAEIKVIDIRGEAYSEEFRYKGMGVTSLDGIDQLVNLEELYISNNLVGTVDLSKNTKLTKLHAYFCGLTALELSENTELTEVLVFHNNIATLDLSKNTKLGKVYAQSNALTSVKLPAGITDLNLSKNKLTAIDADGYKNVTTLNVADNELATLDITACAGLKELNAENNKLAAIDLSKSSELTSLNVMGNELTALDLNGSAQLTQLFAAKNQLTSVDLGGCPELVNVNVSENAIASIAMSELNNLTYLGCWNNALTAIDLTQCPSLECLIANDNQMSVIDLSAAKNISYVKAYNNPFTKLVLNGCESLKDLYLVKEGERNIGTDANGSYFNITGLSEKITSLELDLNGVKTSPADSTYVTELRVFNNKKLTSLDVTKFTDMTSLVASGNGLTTINVKANTELVKLDVNANKIDAVDVSGLTKLAYLNVSGMSTLNTLNIEGTTSALTELYLTKNNAIAWEGEKAYMNIKELTAKTFTLNANNTAITELIVSGNTSLLSLNIDDCPQITSLQVQNNKLLSNLNLDKLTNIEILTITANDFEEIKLSNNTKVHTLNLSNNRIKEVDFSALENLGTLTINTNALTVLDLSANTKINSVSCVDNPSLTSIVLPIEAKGKANVSKDDKVEVTYFPAEETPETPEETPAE